MLLSRPLESASNSVSATLTGLQMQFSSGVKESSAEDVTENVTGQEREGKGEETNDW